MMCPLMWSAGNVWSVLSWVMGTANRMKKKALVILSMGATHLLMASEDGDMVEMDCVPQRPRKSTCVF